MIVESSLNALANARNQYQGTTPKVLCVCSAGLLRSPTLANVLHKQYGWNTRACGVYDYALIPMSTALLRWADYIIFVNKTNELIARNDDNWDDADHGHKVVVLSVPDNFEWMDEYLQKLLVEADIKKHIKELE